MAVGVEAGGDELLLQVFPFSSEYAGVARRQYTLEYMVAVDEVMKAVVDCALDKYRETRAVVDLRAAAYAVTVKGRCELVLEYTREQPCWYNNPTAAQADLCEMWADWVDTGVVADVPYSAVCVDVLAQFSAEFIRRVVEPGMLTAERAMELYGPFVGGLRVARVEGCLVIRGAGVGVRELPVDAVTLPLVTMQTYRLVIKAWTMGEGPPALDRVEGRVQQLVSLPYGRDVVTAWLWQLAGADAHCGYCYVQFFPPRQRYRLALALGPAPTVDVVEQQVSWDPAWTVADAGMSSHACYHVVTAGRPCFLDVAQSTDTIAGEPSPDHYMNGLVDHFIKSHTPSHEPVDDGPERLSLQVSSLGLGNSDDVAVRLYALADQVVSPRAAQRIPRQLGMLSSDEDATARVGSLYRRIDGGSCVDESYFAALRRRWGRRARVPELSPPAGVAYHLFAGARADDGTGIVPWVLDADWALPGWVSYRAVFDPGADLNLAFTSPEDASDIRMDCSGEGILDYGQMYHELANTVVWFTTSIKFRLVASTKVVLRISVPSMGMATAVNIDMRRCVQIAGYSVVSQSFSVVAPGRFQIVDVVRQRGVTAGCVHYKGDFRVSCGVSLIRLGGLIVNAPVRVLIALDDPSALKFVEVNGLRMRPLTRNYVAFVYDPGCSRVVVSVRSTVGFRVAALQIVNVAAFDAAVAADRASRTQALAVRR